MFWKQLWGPETSHRVWGVFRPGSLYCRGMRGTDADSSWDLETTAQRRPVCSSLAAGRSCKNVLGREECLCSQDSGLAGLRSLSRFCGSALPRASWSNLPGSPRRGFWCHISWAAWIQSADLSQRIYWCSSTQISALMGDWWFFLSKSGQGQRRLQDLGEKSGEVLAGRVGGGHCLLHLHCVLGAFLCDWKCWETNHSRMTKGWKKIAENKLVSCLFSGLSLIESLLSDSRLGQVWPARCLGEHPDRCGGEGLATRHRGRHPTPPSVKQVESVNAEAGFSGFEAQLCHLFLAMWS